MANFVKWFHFKSEYTPYKGQGIKLLFMSIFLQYFVCEP